MRRVLIGVGVLVMVYAIGGLATDDDVNLWGVAVFGLAVLALHDGIFMPLVLAGGAAIRRWVPRRWQGTARAAAIVALSVTVVALPLVLGFGRNADNPTILPNAYGKGLILILMGIAVSAAGGRKGIERWRKGRRRRPAG